MDDETTMQVTNRKIATDKISSILIYFVEADDGSGVAPQEDREPTGVRGLKGDSGGQGPSGRQGPAGQRGAVGSEGPPGKIGKIGPPGPVGGKGNVGARGEKSEKGNVGSADPQGPVGPKGSTGLIGVRGVEGVTEAEKARLVFKVFLEIKVNEASVDSVVNEEKRASDVLSVLATHLPIQLAERYGEKMCLVKYHISEDESSVVRMTGGVQTQKYK